jgi:hypothetical protein
MNSILKCRWLEICFREEQDILQQTWTWKGSMNALYCKLEAVMWIFESILYIILSHVGYVTRQITLRESRIQRIFNEHSLLHTVQSLLLNSVTWLLSLIRCLYFSGYFQTALSVFRYSDTLLVGSAYTGVLRTGYEEPFAQVQSRVFSNPLH